MYMPTKFGRKTWREKVALKKIGVGGRITFKQNLKKWIGSIWLRVGSSGSLLGAL
jgi:hypothetical protein